MELTSEQNLILLLSRISLSPEAMDAAANMMAAGERSLDFNVVIKLANMNGVSPLLYRNLNNVRGVPDDVLEKLKSTYLATFGRNVRHSRENMKIIRLLREAAIDAIALKGSLFSDMVLGDLGVYPTCDIDLLVRPQDLDRARKALREAGYHEMPGLAEEDQQQGGYHFSLSNQEFVVELHWNLVMRYFDAPPDFWWEGAMKSEYDGTEITILSPERYLLYGIFRLFTHGFRPLRFLVLLSGLVEKYREQIRWNTLLSLAEDLRMMRVTLFTLKLLRDLLGVGVPQDLADKSVYGYDLLKKLVILGLFHEVKRTRARMSLFTTLLDRPQDTARVLLRRVFPNSAEIRLRYGLPAGSKKVFLYYLANPLLLILRKR